MSPCSRSLAPRPYQDGHSPRACVCPQKPLPRLLEGSGDRPLKGPHLVVGLDLVEILQAEVRRAGAPGGLLHDQPLGGHKRARHPEGRLELHVERVPTFRAARRRPAVMSTLLSRGRRGAARRTEACGPQAAPPQGACSPHEGLNHSPQAHLGKPQHPEVIGGRLFTGHRGNARSRGWPLAAEVRTQTGRGTGTRPGEASEATSPLTLGSRLPAECSVPWGSVAAARGRHPCLRGTLLRLLADGPHLGCCARCVWSPECLGPGGRDDRVEKCRGRRSAEGTGNQVPELRREAADVPRWLSTVVTAVAGPRLAWMD